jgi:hypothetical protein
MNYGKKDLVLGMALASLFIIAKPALALSRQDLDNAVPRMGGQMLDITQEGSNQFTVNWRHIPMPRAAWAVSQSLQQEINLRYAALVNLLPAGSSVNCQGYSAGTLDLISGYKTVTCHVVPADSQTNPGPASFEEDSVPGQAAGSAI